MELDMPSMFVGAFAGIILYSALMLCLEIAAGPPRGKETGDALPWDEYEILERRN